MTLHTRCAWALGIVIAACVSALLADCAIAARRTPLDDKLVKSLQEQVKTDAALAPKLASEQKRITDTRLARKTRDRWLAWTLIAASAAFLACAKKTVRMSVPPNPRAALPEPQPAAIAPHRTAASTPPPLDLAFVDAALATHGRGPESAIPLLQAIQAHYRYLPDEALRRLSEQTAITPAQLAGISSFYGQFRRSPVGRHMVRVCHGTACHVSGARQITEELRRYLAIPDGSDTDPARAFTVGEVACLGCCSLAPVLMVDGHTAGRLTPSTARDALKPFDGRGTA